MAGAALVLSGCGSFDSKREGGPAANPAPAATLAGVSDVPVKIGDPYTIGGVTYTPADLPDYDDVGYASWYGEELAGQPTANGETFDHRIFGCGAEGLLQVFHRRVEPKQHNAAAIAVVSRNRRLDVAPGST